ncbi:MAG: type IV toxin-antitoxin system AbiEi family antitoxin domain-containing protein [Patescibacteria group bacterium]
MKKDYLMDLMRSKSTIFTTKDVSLLWQESDVNFVRKKLYRYVKAGKLYSVRKGVYAKYKNYEKYELATKIFTPAYVSFETVLTHAGIVFQFYNQVFVASYLTREFTIDEQVYVLKKVKDTILTNQSGIDVRDNYFIASPERAFLDVVYLNKAYHFDNLSGIDWDKVDEILPIYGGNRRMEAKIKKYREAAQKGLN